MDIRVLRYFLAVCREKNITRAAGFLHIAQPSLSKQLMELENELGKKLLIRGKREITLTDEGILLRKRAEEIISLVEKTKKEISQNTETLGGEISIGGGQSEIIAQVAACLSTKYPDVKFNLLSGDAVEICERLDHGTLDFAILIEPIDVLKYEYISIPQRNCFGLLMRKDCSLANKTNIQPKDIENIPLIIPKRQGLQRDLADWSGKNIEELNIIATFNVIYNNSTLLVKNGLGYAFSLDNVLDSNEKYNKDNLLCFRPFYPRMEIQLGLVWKKYQVFSKPAEKFLELLKEYIAKNNNI